jgi:hypothetical protein
MSAESLYLALHATVEDQLNLDDPINNLEMIGAIEMLKQDLIAEFYADNDDDPEPMEGACCMPEAA